MDLSTSNLAAQLDSINRSNFGDDNLSRMELINAARKLINRLEQPWEKTYWLTFCQPLEQACWQIATDVELWTHLSTTPQTPEQLGEKTGVEPSLLRRILRLLVATGPVDESSVDKYVATDLSKALSDPKGLINSMRIYNGVSVLQGQRFPAYLKEFGYKFPIEQSKAPWKWIVGLPPDSKLEYWEWLDKQGLSQALNSSFSGVRADLVPWTQVYPIKERLLDEFDGESVLLVDFGGGQGVDISNVAKAVQETHPDARLVLQDRPGVVAEAKAMGRLHPQIEADGHDFFQVNPVKGAKAYYCHSVLHDWPDKEAKEILLQIKAAMKPGYSKVLLNEVILSDSAKKVDPLVAALDLRFGINFAAMERTEQHWKRLLDEVGLKYRGFTVVNARQGSAVIEAEL